MKRFLLECWEISSTLLPEIHALTSDITRYNEDGVSDIRKLHYIFYHLNKNKSKDSFFFQN